jgi:hypothetical protein
MTATKAQFITSFTEDMVATLVVCTALVVLWAAFRPDMVRDSEGRRLPPSITARLAYVALFVIGFLAITVAFHLSGIFVKKLSAIAGFGARFFDQFEGQAPILALLATCGLYSLAPFRELEQHLLAWMHDTGHLRGDVRSLAQHLEECALTPSAEERRRNVESLEAFHVYITDQQIQTINVNSVATWRKTGSLLRHLRAWLAGPSRVMSDDEVAMIRELEDAHGRKTRLAMDIIRTIDSVRKGGDKGDLSSVTDILLRASHGDQREISDAEAQVKAKLEREASPDRPLRISLDELQEHLRKIEGYFQIEYRRMLKRSADLAAKAVLRAGDQAAQRLDELKAAGFLGLGTIKPLTTHRIIWLLMSVALGGFLIYYVSWYEEALRRAAALGEAQGHKFTSAELAAVGRTFLVGIATFVTSISLSSLVGAVFGSNSAHVRARETPWGTYVFAGLVAVAMFFALQLMREAITLSLDATLAAHLNMPQDPIARLKNFAPWSILQFLTAVAICRLGRQSPWRFPSHDFTPNMVALLERLIDGVILGCVMIGGFAAALGLMQLFGLQRAAILKPGFDPEVVRNLFIFGFFVGALVVRDVRSGAHAQLLASNSRSVGSTSATDLAPVGFRQ